MFVLLGWVVLVLVGCCLVCCGCCFIDLGAIIVWVGLLVCCRCGCGRLLLIVLFSVLVVRIYSYLLFVSRALL